MGDVSTPDVLLNRYPLETHLEVFDRLHGSSVDLQLVLAEPPFKQLLVCEFKGDLFVSSQCHRGLEFLHCPSNRTAAHTTAISF